MERGDLKRKKLLSIFFINISVFMIMVPLGTFLHESFHFLAARLLACQASLHKDFIDYSGCQKLDYYCSVIDTETICLNDFIIYLAGPAGTLLISLAGLWVLFKRHSDTLLEITGLILSLFHLRISANAMMGLLNGNYHLSTDEHIISSYLGVGEILTTLLVHTISLLIIGLVIYRLGWTRIWIYFPSGLIGFAIGYLLFF